MPSPRKRKRPKVLITGGATRAYLDRVRFLTNFSSGELAFRLCRALCRRGFDVALVCGPTSQPFYRLPLKIYRPVETATEMSKTVLSLCRTFRPEAAVFTAAVLDFEPTHRESGKVSSQRPVWTVRLQPTPKIIDEVGKRFPKIWRMGFKLVWETLSERRAHSLALSLLQKKGLQGVCLNSLSEIREKKHPARLFLADGSFWELRTKEAIAQAIARILTRSSSGAPLRGCHPPY